MSVVNMAKNLNQIHPLDVLCFKHGEFYNCYGKDSYIIAYLMNYKINQTKQNIPICGFTKKAASKIMAKLEQKKINYIFIDTRHNYDIDYKNENGNLNQYEEILKKAITYIKKRNKIEKIYSILLEKIEENEIKNKIEKIEEILYESRKI